MILQRRIYRQTLSIRQREKKRQISEVSDMSDFVNQNFKINRFEFLKKSKGIIYKNYPGISLEPERYYGRVPNDHIIIKAKTDSIGRSCPLSMRQHSSNSIYFLLCPNINSVYLKCFKCSPGMGEAGKKPLDMDSCILESIMPNLVISEKSAAKKTKVRHTQLECLDQITIVQFEHIVLHLDVSTILEFYDANKFVQLAARLDKKSPVFSNWNTRSFEMNEDIDLNYNNIAILCGPESGIFVLDVDINDDGLNYFQRLCTKNNYRYDLSTTCILTPSGGIHLYFKYCPEFESNSVRMRNTKGEPIGLDIRSKGGCVICPPSTYQNGKYQFLCMKKPQDCPKFIFDLID